MSSQRERFCQLIAFRGYTPTDAYVEAYQSEGTENTVRVAASRLMSDPEVELRIAKLREPILAKEEMTLETHLRDLKILRDDAHMVGELGTAVTAESQRGKAAGLYVEKHAHADGLSLEQLVTGSFDPKHESGQPVKAGPRRKKDRR